MSAVTIKLFGKMRRENHTTLYSDLLDSKFPSLPQNYIETKAFNFSQDIPEENTYTTCQQKTHKTVRILWHPEIC